MSKADQKRVAEIQNILKVDEATAIATLNIIEDYFDPNWSQMTNNQFRQTVKAAYEGFLLRRTISEKMEAL